MPLFGLYVKSPHRSTRDPGRNREDEAATVRGAAMTARNRMCHLEILGVADEFRP